MDMNNLCCIFEPENYEKFMQQVNIQDYAKYIGLSLLLKGNSYV